LLKEERHAKKYSGIKGAVKHLDYSNAFKPRLAVIPYEKDYN